MGYSNAISPARAASQPAVIRARQFCVGTLPYAARYCGAMSQKNVGAVEDAYEALASGGLDQFMEHFSDDFDHRAIKGSLDDRGPIHGKDALRAFLQDWMDTFDEFWIEPVEVIDAGGDVVVALLRYGGHAKLSGIEPEETFGVMFTIRDRKIVRAREYATRDEALEAAGLSE
jgi:ketosteroid isomerase-like protein